MGLMDSAILRAYDNGGLSRDRYTIIVKSTGNKVGNSVIYKALVVCRNPNTPGGISQWMRCIEGKHLGKEILFESLPDHVRRHVLTKFISSERILNELGKII